MQKIERLSPLVLAASVAIGLAMGLLIQFARSTWGQAPFSPPVSLAGSLAIIGVVLLVLGIRLRRAVTHRSERLVNPFQAVKLLAGARAGSLGGALFAGFGGGLTLQLLTRSVPTTSDVWVPMVLVLGGGVFLAVCAIITERMCRIPPSETDAESDANAENGPDDELAPDVTRN